MKTNLGGKRLGSGNKMEVNLSEWPRSTHDLSYAFRSTMSAGTLVPFASELMLPGDKARISLNAKILTLPTNGPLFGSFKVQLDLFKFGWRLYNSWVHNNNFDIGRNVSQLKIPKIRMTALPMVLAEIDDIDNCQINSSCLLSYFGLRGIGVNLEETSKTRDFNAIPILGYWDIIKNYYANLQESIGAVIHNTEAAVGFQSVTQVKTYTNPTGPFTYLSESPTVNEVAVMQNGTIIEIEYTVNEPVTPDNMFFVTENNGILSLSDLCGTDIVQGTEYTYATFDYIRWGSIRIVSWQYIADNQPLTVAPNVVTFSLQNIDDMKMAILAYQNKTAPYIINNLDKAPYKYLYEQPNGMPNSLKSQEGLAVKTYLSDRFNNWLDSTFHDYVNSVSEIDTTGGSFNMEQLLLNEKIYEHYSRIMASGGSFDDWQEVTFDVRQAGRAEMPIYIGGMSGELVFQEVVSTAASAGEPLASLAGRGQLANEKGGKISISFDEISYLMGLVSITPRLDYSQGIKWDLMLDTWDDTHKPVYDQIGFQDLITQEMAWWDTAYNAGTTEWTLKSAGVQPAWTQYTTNVNRTFGGFAEADNQMFMTLNRRYRFNGTGIDDLTTYIDPANYNYIFAQQALDAQNFWTQIGVGLEVTRVMSPKIMPML